MLIFNEDVCTGCGLCILSCPRRSIVQDAKGKVPHYVGERGCMACGHCVAVCPRNVITHKNMPKEDFVENDTHFTSEEMEKFLGTKRSIRNFKDKIVDDEIFEKLISAAEHAPSEANYHENGYVIVSDNDVLYKLKEIIVDGYRAFLKDALAKGMAEDSIEIQTSRGVIWSFDNGYDPIFWNTPYMIFIHGPIKHTFSGYDAIVSGTYLMMQAETMGVGTCIIGRALYYPDLFNELLGIPNGNRIYSAIAVGYPKLKYKRTVHRNKPEIKRI